MVRNPPTDRMFMERIVVAARLKFGMLPFGVNNAQIVRVYRRWLRRNFNVLNFPWCAKVCRRLRLLRLMTVFRTSGDGKCLFWCNSYLGVLSSKEVYICPEFLTLSFSLSFGLVANWRDQFLADVDYLSRRQDQDEFRFVNDVLARTFD